MPAYRFLAGRRAASVALVLATATVAAGCGSSGPSSAGTSSATTDIATAALKFAQCMRNHGVPNFPSPHVSVSGGSTQVAMMAPATMVKTPAGKTATRACRGILPDVGNSSPAEQAARNQAKRAMLLTFGRCLRAHGEPNFPDPSAQGQLSISAVTAAGVSVHTPQMLAAGRACVGVTHGAITLAQVAALVNGTAGGGSGSASGTQTSGGG
jgi:hypothetical protein